MKFLFIPFMILSFSASADVVGTWAYSGSGCRNSSLDPDSHVSKAPQYSDDEPVVTEAIFVFKRDRTVEMNSIFENGEVQTERGNYSLNGDRMTVDTWQGAEFILKGNRILLHIDNSEYDEFFCPPGDKFIYILAPVD